MAPHTLKKRKLADSLHTADNSKGAIFSANGASAESSDEDNSTHGEHLLSRHGDSTSDSRVRPSGNTVPFLGAEYNSNMFKLQTEELLARVRPDYKKRMAKVENALRKLKTIIEQIPSRDPVPVRLV